MKRNLRIIELTLGQGEGGAGGGAGGGFGGGFNCKF